LKKIIVLQIAELNNRLKDIWLKIECDAKALNFILKNTYNPEYWARPVRRYIQDNIEEEISNLLINKKISGTINLSADSKKLIFK
jgi:ATP-dependent Clp protease ATP-binding subunit ClpA